MKGQLVITSTDRSRLGSLLASEGARSTTPWPVLDALECELEEAAGSSPEEAPDDVVTMNSTVHLICLATRRQVTLTVAYPDDVDLIDDGISVLDPLGSQLIGCEVGDLVKQNGQQWRIAEIVFQPERAGAFHL